MSENNLDEHWMQRALLLAEVAKKKAEVPVGAVIVYENNIVGQGYNSPIEMHDPTSHAEIQAIRQASQALKNYRLVGATLYVTLEPCLMCIGAIVHARLSRVVFGAYDSRVGATSLIKENIAHKLNHQVEWLGGVLEKSCADLLKQFFSDKR